jgi:hypothetical protein
MKVIKEFKVYVVGSIDFNPARQVTLLQNGVLAE